MAPAAQGATDRELFGVERLDELLLKCGACNAEACIDRIRTAVTAFCGNAPPSDDRTLIALRCM